MLIIKTNQPNTLVVTVSQNSELTNPEYLFSFTHIFSKENVTFIPTDISTHKSRYDEFYFVEGNGVGQIRFPYEGQYLYSIWEQPAGSGNLNPAFATNVVENGDAQVIVQSAITVNSQFDSFISNNEFNSNYIFAPDEIQPLVPSPTPSVTTTNTPTTTQTPSVTPSVTQTNTPSITPSETPTNTPSVTQTNTPSITPSETPTNTPSVTPTETPTNTPSVTPTTTMTPTNTNTPSITPSPTPFDSDATTFLNAVVATGGTLNATISAATNTLFTSLKSNGLYTSMKAMYPFIGSTSGSCAINAVSPGTYNITWFGGMSFGVSGATGNGTNGWGNTNLIQTAFTQNSVSAGVYQITSLSGGAEFVFGNFSTGGLPAIQLSTYLTTLGGNYAYRLGSTSITSQTYSGNTGMFVISRTTGSTTTHNLYRNGSLINSTSNSYTATTTPNAIYVFARQGSGGATQEFSPQTLAFIFFADGLSGSQVSTLSSIINTFNTSLGRNVY